MDIVSEYADGRPRKVRSGKGRPREYTSPRAACGIYMPVALKNAIAAAAMEHDLTFTAECNRRLADSFADVMMGE